MRGLLAQAGAASRPSVHVSLVTGGLNWLEIKVPSLADALDLWHPLLTTLGYEGSLAWDKGRGYTLGKTRVLFLEVDEVPVA